MLFVQLFPLFRWEYFLFFLFSRKYYARRVKKTEPLYWGWFKQKNNDILLVSNDFSTFDDSILTAKNVKTKTLNANSKHWHQTDWGHHFEQHSTTNMSSWSIRTAEKESFSKLARNRNQCPCESVIVLPPKSLMMMTLSLLRQVLYRLKNGRKSKEKVDTSSISDRMHCSFAKAFFFLCSPSLSNICCRILLPNCLLLRRLNWQELTEDTTSATFAVLLSRVSLSQLLSVSWWWSLSFPFTFLLRLLFVRVSLFPYASASHIVSSFPAALMIFYSVISVADPSSHPASFSSCILLNLLLEYQFFHSFRRLYFFSNSNILQSNMTWESQVEAAKKEKKMDHDLESGIQKEDGDETGLLEASEEKMRNLNAKRGETFLIQYDFFNLILYSLRWWYGVSREDIETERRGNIIGKMYQRYIFMPLEETEKKNSSISFKSSSKSLTSLIPVTKKVTSLDSREYNNKT